LRRFVMGGERDLLHRLRQLVRRGWASLSLA